MNIQMTDDEIAKLKEYANKSNDIFEFGCGGSTVLISHLKNIKNLHSVDSDLNWINKVKEKVKENVVFHFVNIGEIGDWGHPKDESQKAEWPKYSNTLKDLPDYFPDLVFVDGRFRVACALKSIEKMKKESYLMVHDYHPSRNYSVIEKWFNKIDSVNTLSVFKKKENIDIQEVQEIIKQYEYDDS